MAAPDRYPNLNSRAAEQFDFPFGRLLIVRPTLGMSSQRPFTLNKRSLLRADSPSRSTNCHQTTWNPVVDQNVSVNTYQWQQWLFQYRLSLRSDHEEQVWETADEGVLMHSLCLHIYKFRGLELLTRLSIRWLLNTVFSVRGRVYRIVVLHFWLDCDIVLVMWFNWETQKSLYRRIMRSRRFLYGASVNAFGVMGNFRWWLHYSIYKELQWGKKSLVQRLRWLQTIKLGPRDDECASWRAFVLRKPCVVGSVAKIKSTFSPTMRHA